MNRNLVLIFDLKDGILSPGRYKKIVSLNKKVAKSCNNGEHIEFYGKFKGYCFLLNKNTVERIISQSKAIACFFVRQNGFLLNLNLSCTSNIRSLCIKSLSAYFKRKGKNNKTDMNADGGFGELETKLSQLHLL